MWYTKKEQPARFGFWYCGLGLGQIVGGIISYGFQHVKNASLEGWRVMFIVLGLVTVLIGVWTFFCLPDTPMSANFLEEREIVRVLERVSENQTGVENKKFKMSQAVELAKDPQIYFMLMITVLVGLPCVGLSTSCFMHCMLMSLFFFLLVFGFKWCYHNLLSNPNQELWLHVAYCGPTQHAIRHHQHRSHHPLRYCSGYELKQVVVDRRLSCSGSSWWSFDVVPAK